MTNLVCSIIFKISAAAVISFDLKIQKIPLWLILINYISFCIIINPVLLVGVPVFFWMKHLDKPIDIIYILALGVSMCLLRPSYAPICIFPIFIQLLISKKDKISLMVSIEIAYLIYLYLILGNL